MLSGKKLLISSGRGYNGEVIIECLDPLTTVLCHGASIMNDYERGYEQFKQMVGPDQIEALIDRFKAVCPDFETEVVSVVGGRIWTRPGIDLKTRSLCSIGILAALGRVNALKLNFQMALNNGVQLEEMFEAIFQVAAYAGFPAAWDALVMLETVLAEKDADKKA
jgi:4-carboxymuconolactone decarboxylase